MDADARAANAIRLDRLDSTDIDAVCGWRYDGDYAAYDLATSDRSCFDDPASEYLAIRREAELIGFVCLGAEARVAGMTKDAAVLDIGIGIRPDLTGQGESRRLMPAILWALDRHTDHVTLRAVVKAWNRRAQRAAAHGGFQATGTHENERGSWVLLVRRPPRVV